MIILDSLIYDQGFYEPLLESLVSEMFGLNQRNFESFAAVIRVFLPVGMNILATSIGLIKVRTTSVYDVLVFRGSGMFSKWIVTRVITPI